MFFTSAENLAGLNTLSNEDQVLGVENHLPHSLLTGYAEEGAAQDEEEGGGFPR